MNTSPPEKRSPDEWRTWFQSFGTLHQAFEELNALYFRFIDNDERGFETYLRSLDLMPALTLHDRILRCIDEGCAGGLHSAGSGILWQFSDIVSSFRRHNIEGVSWHHNCGAAAKYAAEKLHNADLAHFLAQDFSEKLATAIALDETLLSAKPLEITASAMWRPADKHIARVCVLDKTAHFNWTNMPWALPPAFVVSYGILPKADAVFEAGLACSIAFGEHGFGSLLTLEQPFYLVLLAETENEVSQMADEVASLQEEFGLRLRLVRAPIS